MRPRVVINSPPFTLFLFSTVSGYPASPMDSSEQKRACFTIDLNFILDRTVNLGFAVPRPAAPYRFCRRSICTRKYRTLRKRWEFIRQREGREAARFYREIVLS